MIEFSEIRGPNKIFGSFISQNEPNILFGPLISENSIIAPPLVNKNLGILNITFWMQTCLGWVTKFSLKIANSPTYNITNQCFFFISQIRKVLLFNQQKRYRDFDLVLIYVFKQKRLYSSTVTSCDISSSQVGVFGNSQENERLTRPIFHSGETGKHILCFCKYNSWMLNFCQKVYIISSCSYILSNVKKNL